MLEAQGLTKSYASVIAVKDVSFTLAPGQVLGCLGPNGSGKSTTVKMLIGLLEPSRGKVLFNGEDIHQDLAGFRKLLGYVPEEPNLYPYLSGYEYLEMIGLLRGIPQAILDKKMRFAPAPIFAGCTSPRFHGFLLERHAAADSTDRCADGRSKAVDLR